MHKIWMVTNPLRLGLTAAVGVITVAAVIHFAVLSSPRYCDHLGWCSAAPSANAQLPAARN